jgi:hypothetical protein
MPRRPIPKMLTIAAVARRLDLPYMRVNRLVRRGVLIPDAFAAGGISLFNEKSIVRVETTLRELKIFPGGGRQHLLQIKS